jgi:hypothetical protein
LLLLLLLLLFSLTLAVLLLQSFLHRLDPRFSHCPAIC